MTQAFSTGLLNYEREAPSSGVLQLRISHSLNLTPAGWQAEPILLQRMTSSRQGKPEKESSVQRKANCLKAENRPLL